MKITAKTKLTGTVLNRMGYRRAKTLTEGGKPWYFKRRLTRSRKSRCTVQVELHCAGYADVNAREVALVEGAPTGLDFSNDLRTVGDLRGWEQFAICP